MLVEILIRNFALIDDLRLRVGRGLSVLTGETGAGKSIIVDALSAALGERTGAEVVRTGSGSALIEVVFDLSDAHEADRVACQLGFEPEDGLLILSREIAREGRSGCRINGRATTASMLREVTACLIDVHGQHEHQSLLSVPLHVDVFDGWIGEPAARLRARTQALHSQLSTVRAERDRLQTDERERARLLDLYQFQAQEIEAARLEPDEEESLQAERNRLANAERLFAAASEVWSALGGDQGAVDKLGEAAGHAGRMARVDPETEALLEAVNSALFGAQEALAAVRRYRDDLEANPGRLEQIEDRLDLLRTLKRKYGDTLEEVIEYGRSLAGKLEDLAHAQERSAELDADVQRLESELASASSELTALRRESAPAFEKAVETELAELAMDRTRFEVSIRPSQPGSTGADAVEFLISPNPGEPVKPLARIASGGEMSRIMLALKTVMLTAGPRAGQMGGVPTLVFDEIDTGIGGRTAQALGDKLASLGQTCQVMCVTHLPQIASKATNHYCVAKVVREGRTVVTLAQLDGEERVAELARMLGAEETSGAAAQHAREMLSLADQRNS